MTLEETTFEDEPHPRQTITMTRDAYEARLYEAHTEGYSEGYDAAMAQAEDAEFDEEDDDDTQLEMEDHLQEMMDTPEFDGHDLEKEGEEDE